MPRTQVFQSHMTSGVLDPGLSARTDINHYYQGMRQGDNVQCLPQGGVRRRPGTLHIARLSGPARIAGFMFNTEQTYLLSFEDLLVRIFRNGLQVATLATLYTAAQVEEIDFVQSADTMIIVHPEHPPQELFRGPGGDTDWTYQPYELTSIPTAVFVGTSNPGSQTLTFSGTEDSQFRFVVNGQDSSLVRYTTTTADMQDRIKNALLQEFLEQGISVVEIDVQGTGQVYDITLDGGAADAQAITITVVEGTVSAPVTNYIRGVSSEEPLWSPTRGWPTTVVFHEGRLVFGGSRDKPNTIAASVTNSFGNFLLGDQYPDQAIVRTIDSDQLNAIVGMATSRKLQIFTSGGEFYVPQTPMTPDTATLTRQTNYGSAPIKPEVLDGATLFVDRSRRVIREFLFEFVEDGYRANSLNALAPHLITGVRAMAIQRTGGAQSTNYVFIINQDGTCAVLNTLREQDIAGWSRWTTDGEFYDVAAEDRTIYFVCRRVIQGQTVYDLERLDDEMLVDDGIRQTAVQPTAVWLGVNHLLDKVCKVIADGVAIDDVIPVNNQAETTRASTTVQIGLNFVPAVRPMPLNSQGVGGQIAMERKRVIEVKARVADTKALTINGDDVQGYRFGNTVLGEVRAPYTGIIKHRPSRTPWADDPEVLFSQNEPAPMTILGYDITVEY